MAKQQHISYDDNELPTPINIDPMAVYPPQELLFEIMILGGKEVRLPATVIRDGVPEVVVIQGTLHSVDDLQTAWNHWSDGFASSGDDSMEFNWDDRIGCLRIKFRAYAGSERLYPTDRKSYFVFDIDSEDARPLMSFLLCHPTPWIPMFGARMRFFDRAQMQRFFDGFPDFKNQMRRVPESPHD